MSEFYDELRADAEELIEELGQDCVLRQQTNSGGSAYAPTKSNTDTGGKCVDIGDKTLEKPNRMGSTRVRKVLFSTSAGKAPAHDDLLVLGITAAQVDGSTKFTQIEEVERISPAGTDLLYILDLKIG